MVFYIGTEKILTINSDRVDAIALEEFNTKELLRKAKINNITK